MINLYNILLKEYEKKENSDKIFKTYECYFLIKSLRKYNKSDLYERVRAIKDVTIVIDKNSKKLDIINKRLEKEEYNLLLIKFNSKKDPLEKIEEIKTDILRSNPDKDNFKIIGVTSVRPQEKTLDKV